MKNIQMSREGDMLVIKINLKERHGQSASGKTTVVATTGGNVTPPSGDDGCFDPNMKIGINVYTK